MTLQPTNYFTKGLVDDLHHKSVVYVNKYLLNYYYFVFLFCHCEQLNPFSIP